MKIINSRGFTPLEVRRQRRLPMRKRIGLQTGFTIIELIIVITIVSIILAVVIVNFSQTRLQFALSRVSYKFSQDLIKAQNMAVTSQKYIDSFGVEQPISGYGIYMNLSTLGDKKYIIYADKSPGNEKYESSDYTVETIDFSLTELGIVIKQINNVVGNKASVNFNIINLNTEINQLGSGQNNANFVFALKSNLTKTRVVSANKVGLIEVK